ncbi:MAG TPA: hypothetical protein VKF36_02995 [Syntrophorhabdales bacterium]|nr:hypothetical protein [Syntrophorhabdales bacterium]
MGAKRLHVGLFGAFFLLVMGMFAESDAQVSVDIRIGPPPVYRIAAPPPVVVIPGTYVYVVPGIAVDIFFYQGSWYRLHEGHWFRAQSYNGPWGYLPPERLPRPLLQLPPDYRNVPPGYRRVPYGELKKNWAGWDRNRYWDRDKAWHEGWHARPEERGREERGVTHEQERREGPEGRGGEERGRGHEEYERH